MCYGAHLLFDGHFSSHYWETKPQLNPFTNANLAENLWQVKLVLLVVSVQYFIVVLQNFAPNVFHISTICKMGDEGRNCILSGYHVGTNYPTLERDDR